VGDKKAKGKISVKGKIMPVPLELSIVDVKIASPKRDRYLVWDNDIIGIDNLDFANIEVTANPTNAKSTSPPPRQILVEVARRPPKRSLLVGDAGMSGADDAEASNRTTEQFSLSLDNSSDKFKLIYRNDDKKRIDPNSPPKPNSVVISVATYARRHDPDPKFGPSTSGKHFLENNNFVNRGNAFQEGPDESSERPPPRELFLSGGVEVIELTIPAQPNVKTNSSLIAKICIRSPADVFYYSGHGHSNMINPPGALTSVPGNMTPEDLLKSWQKNKDFGVPTMRAFIIAGCSVLSIFPLTGPLKFDEDQGRKGVGMRWKNLLISKGGLVEYMCGYFGRAPSDKAAGNALGEKMGKILFSNPGGDHAANWMKIHLDHNVATVGAALTGNTFYYIDTDWRDSIEDYKIDP
jgi:hypothetical protein